MQFRESKQWFNSLRRTSSSPTRGNRRAILCVETMEGRLSLSAMPLLPAVQRQSAHFNPQPDPPTTPVHLSKQPAIIIHLNKQPAIIIHLSKQPAISALCPSDPRPYTDPNQ
jgi:hypothetical protein